MSSLLKNLPQNATRAKEILESFEIAKETCSTPSVYYEAEKLPHVDVTFHDLIVILAGIATMACCLLSLYIICGHLFHWTNRKEQKQIALCVLYLPVYAVINFFAGWFYGATTSLIPILQLYNAKGLIAVFLLYVAYLCPEGVSMGQFHNDLERKGYDGKTKHNSGSLRWFRTIWVSVFQLVPITLAIYPINYIILHVTCPLDQSREYADIILASVQFVSTNIAFTAVYIYYKRNMSQLKPHRGWRKLNSFQSLVWFQATQALIFPIVTQANAYHPTSYVSVEDFSNGIPAFMTCWECLIWSIFFLKTFTFTPYRNAVLQERAARPAKVETAIMDTLNQMDLIHGTFYMFQILICMADRKDSKDIEKLSKEESASFAPVDSVRVRQD